MRGLTALANLDLLWDKHWLGKRGGVEKQGGNWWQWDMLSPWRWRVTAHRACCECVRTFSAAHFNTSSANCHQKAIYLLTGVHRGCTFPPAHVILFIYLNQGLQVQLLSALEVFLYWYVQSRLYIPFAIKSLTRFFLFLITFSQPASSATVSKLLHFSRVDIWQSRECVSVNLLLSAVTHISLLKLRVTSTTTDFCSWVSVGHCSQKGKYAWFQI